ncbi:FAD-binding protein [Cryobacterium breve]|uniref:FAD-binding protein n=1 Tax=Cryobacterium breve TaxID=1259258 RepID=UPI0032B104C0
MPVSDASAGAGAEPADAAPTTFAELTTIRTGGRPRLLLAAETEDDLVDTALDVWASGEDWLLLGGGSNTVAADTEFDGTVVRVLTRGITVERSADRVVLRVQAGEPWDDLVAHTVAQGWSGIEALSGIPGSTGAAPVQNIGAYGQELANSLVAIDFLDYESGERRRIPAAELELGYRTSLLKHGLRGVVVAVELEPVGHRGRGIRSRRVAQPAPRLPPARGCPRRAPRRPGAARGRAHDRAAVTCREGDAAQTGRPGCDERRLVLHEPDRLPELLADPAGVRAALAAE